MPAQTRELLAPTLRRIGTRGYRELLCGDTMAREIGNSEAMGEANVQIRIAEAHIIGVPTTHPGGFQPSIIWDHPKNSTGY